MKTAKFIRIFAVLGILGLLFLQYSWFKNSYVLMEHDILEKAMQSLSASIESDMSTRMTGIFGKTIIQKDAEIPKDAKVVRKNISNKSNDITDLVQDYMFSIGKGCK